MLFVNEKCLLIKIIISNSIFFSLFYYHYDYNYYIKISSICLKRNDLFSKKNY